MDIKVKTNKEKMAAALRAFHETLPHPIARALNLTAYQVKDALVEEMKKVFDRPVPYTLNAPYVNPASPKYLAAKILLREFGGKSRSEKYLLVQTEGGQRRLKAFESALRAKGVLPAGYYAVPGEKCPLDQYGNMSPGFIVQILSYLQAFGEQGYSANITEAKKSKLKTGTKSKRGMEYFVVRHRRGGLRAGIWRRTSLGRLGNAVEPMIMFVKQPSYSRLLTWHEIAERVVARHAQENMEIALSQDNTIKIMMK